MITGEENARRAAFVRNIFQIEKIPKQFSEEYVNKRKHFVSVPEGGCADGETEITTNKNSHDEEKGDKTCNGGLQSCLCASFKPAPSKRQLEQDAADAAKAAAKAAAEQAALELAARAFCRVAVPAFLAPLELLEDVIPIVGEIPDVAEIAATPAIIEGCVKGIGKEGKAELKAPRKKHTL